MPTLTSLFRIFSRKSSRQGVRCCRVLAEVLEERNLLSFAGPLNYSWGPAPTAVVAADFNSDDHPDVLAGAGVGIDLINSVALFRNNGDGTLADPVVHALSRPSSIAAKGDVNGDTVLDLLLTGQGGLSVLFGNGDGTFRESSPSPVPTPGVVADLNGDGLDDLATSTGVHLGNGDGTFRLVHTISIRGATNRLVAADFDQDGYLDLAIVVNIATVPPQTQAGVHVLLNNGDATFRASQYYPTSFTGASFLGFGDLDGDQVEDLFVLQYTPSRLYLFRGNGDGTFQRPPGPSAMMQGFGARVADFNNDGRLDLATVSSGYGQVNVYLNNGDVSFAASRVLAGFDPSALDSGDLDGDGTLDLVVGNSGSQDVSVRLGFGDGTFDTGLNLTVGANPTAVNAGDVNGDGLPDLVSANANTNSVRVLLNAGDGSFQPGRDYAAGGYPFDIQLADLDGDGALDLVVVNATGNSVSTLRNNGDGTFQPGRNYVVGLAPNSAVVGDFTGDGWLDLAVTNRGPDTVSLLQGNGDGTFAAAVSFAAGENPTAVAAGDFNGDKTLDLAVANLGRSRVTLLFGNGDGAFQSPREVPVGFRPGAIQVADYDYDGYLDLAVADDGRTLSTGSVWVLLGNGDGTFRNPRGYGQGLISLALTAGDFDLDGVLDLAVGVGSGIKVLLGNGDGTFREATRGYGASSFIGSLAAADFDADGHTDLVFGRAFLSNTLSVLFNLGGRGSAPGSRPGAQPPAGGPSYSFAVDQVLIDALSITFRRPAVSMPR